MWLLIGCVQTIVLEDTARHPRTDKGNDTAQGDTSTDSGGDSGRDTGVSACEGGSVRSERYEIRFEEREPSCAWEEGDNLESRQGVVTARAEDTQALSVPEGLVLCDFSLTFDNSGGDEDEGQHSFRYDDAFLLTFDDVVLAASHGPMVDALPEDDGFFTYTWTDVAGSPLSFEEVAPYCLGVDAGGTCRVPEPESSGMFSLRIDDTSSERLAMLARAAGRAEFALVTMGDNDEDVDCSRAGLSFHVNARVASR
jgi:hypothetical protein